MSGRATERRRTALRVGDVRLQASTWRRLTINGFLAPAIAVSAFIVLYPAASALWTSFTDASLLRLDEQRFVGLDNYLSSWNSEIVRNAFVRSLRWVVVVIIAQAAIGLGLALFLNSEIRGRGLLRSVTLFPYVIPTVVVAVLWGYFFNYNFGLVNPLLMLSGATEQPVGWLNNPGLSFWTVSGAMVWHGVPLMIVVLLAALQGIPSELLDAAKVDGATAWGLFRFVTWPLLLPTLLMLLLLRTMWMAHHVDLIFLLTGGGPGFANYTAPVHIYITATRHFEIGFASAIAVVLGAILLGLGIVYLRAIERRSDFFGGRR